MSVGPQSSKLIATPSPARPPVLATLAAARSVFDGRAWSDIFADIETEVDGRVLKAKLRGSSTWYGLLDGADPLFLHE